MLNTIEILRSLALFLCIDNPISRSLWNLDIFPCSGEFGIQFCLKHFIYHVYYRQKLNWKPSFNGLFVHVNTQSVIIAFLLWFSHLARIDNIIMSWVFISSSIACLLSDLKVLFVIVGYIMFVNFDILSQLLLINFFK